VWAGASAPPHQDAAVQEFDLVLGEMGSQLTAELVHFLPYVLSKAVAQIPHALMVRAKNRANGLQGLGIEIQVPLQPGHEIIGISGHGPSLFEPLPHIPAISEEAGPKTDQQGKPNKEQRFYLGIHMHSIKG